MHRLDAPDELSPADIAEIFGVSEHTVKSWREKRTGPKHHRRGKYVVYDPRDVEAWLNRDYQQPTTHNKENNS